jgi:hypothetical protein
MERVINLDNRERVINLKFYLIPFLCQLFKHQYIPTKSILNQRSRDRCFKHSCEKI